MSSQNDPSKESGGGAGGGGTGGSQSGGEHGGGQSGEQGSQGSGEEKTDVGHKTASKGINPVQHSE